MDQNTLDNHHYTKTTSNYYQNMLVQSNNLDTAGMIVYVYINDY